MLFCDSAACQRRKIDADSSWQYNTVGVHPSQSRRRRRSGIFGSERCRRRQRGKVLLVLDACVVDGRRHVGRLCRRHFSVIDDVTAARLQAPPGGSSIIKSATAFRSAAPRRHCHHGARTACTAAPATRPTINSHSDSNAVDRCPI